MQINRAADTVRVTLTAEEAEAVRDDLGAIWASQVSAAGDKLHSLLESVTSSAEEQPVAERVQPRELYGPDNYSEIAMRGWTA